MSKTFTYADTIVDSAMVIIEENLNHDFGDATYNFGDIVIDSAAYAFDVSGLTIDEEYALSDDEQEMIRDTLMDWMERYANRVDTTGMSAHSIILADISNWMPQAFQSDPVVSLDIKLVIGEEPGVIQCEEWFEYEGFAWEYADINNGCGPNGAAAMTQNLNSYYSSVNCHLTCEGNGYYSHIEDQDFSASNWPNPNEDHPDDLDGYLDYLLWNNKYEDPQSTCLTNYEMVFHTLGAETIANGPAKPSGKVATTFWVFPVHIFNHDQHGLNVFYGKLRCK